jgi:hypothetical protein
MVPGQPASLAASCGARDVAKEDAGWNRGDQIQQRGEGERAEGDGLYGYIGGD